MPESALWPLLAGLVEALQAIHACRVVHRDLKPANVLLATDGPRVIDFGISRAADGTALTAAGVVFGTPGYMSPEQAEGKAAGPESDVFALGCVIAYAATGAGPFGSGTAAAVLYRVVYGEAALDAVPPQLREIVAACLTKDPAARPMLRDLAATIANRMNAAGPTGVAFWPQSVAGIIGAYQAKFDQEARTGRPADPQEFSWASSVHPQSPPSGPGNHRGVQQPQAPPAGSGGGWPYATGYPQPQGYDFAQPVPPPPRGYLPASGGPSAGAGNAGAGNAGAGVAGVASMGAAPGGYPQQYQPGSRGAIYSLPGSMVTAVRLMYAGAAYAVLYAIGVALVANDVIKNHPYATAGRTTVGGVVTLTIFLSIIEIVLWLGIARACKNRRNGARVTGTVLFGFHTFGTIGVLANGHPDLGPAKVLTLIGWLIACGAVVFLWQRTSNAFFKSPASIGR